MGGGQSPTLGESRNSKYNLHHSKNVSNPITSQGLGMTGTMSSGRNPGTKSPMNNRSQHAADGQDPQDNIDIDVGNDDYDEETDEFANYSQ